MEEQIQGQVAINFQEITVIFHKHLTDTLHFKWVNAKYIALFLIEALDSKPVLNSQKASTSFMECVDVATFLGQVVEYDCACFEL